MLKLNEPFKNREIFIISFLLFQIWVLIVIFFVAVFGWFFSPWIRIQEAKPTDPDPKHWYLYIIQLIGFDNTNLKLQDHHCCLNNKQFQILRLDANKRIVNSKKTNFKIVKLKNIEQNGWKTIMKYKIFK